MEDAELDFLLLLMGILEEYQSKLYFLKTFDYQNFQARTCNETPVPITQFQQCCLMATSTYPMLDYFVADTMVYTI